MPSPSSPRVLLVTEHASFRYGGEASLPAHYFRVLAARQVPVWMITHSRVREELLARFPDLKDRILFIEDNWLHKFLWKIGSPLPAQLYYFTLGMVSRVATQMQARQMARELIRREGINIIHQAIPVSPKEPSILHSMGVPVIIGPLNGGMAYPPAFQRERNLLGRVVMAVGRAASNLINVLMPGKPRAARILVANERTAQALPASCQHSVTLCVENGVDLSLWRAAPERAPSDQCTFVFMGRLVDWKAVDIIIDAFAKMKGREHARLWIIGDGPMAPAWKGVAERLGVLTDAPESWGKVAFWGWKSQPECAQLIARADALLLPSLMECGGAVVLEAMAMKLPVVASAWGGPVDYIDPSCGYLIETTSREAMVEGFSQAMSELAASPEKRLQLGQAGLQKVKDQFDWEKKVDFVMATYEDAIRRMSQGAATRS